LAGAVLTGEARGKPPLSTPRGQIRTPAALQLIGDFRKLFSDGEGFSKTGDSDCS
jgi:hypothetical protein